MCKNNFLNQSPATLKIYICKNQYLMGLLNDCPSCYEQTINQCVDQLVFVLGLTAGETYLFTFTDHHIKEHVVEVLADINGNATIDTTEFSNGFFNIYSGTKTVTWKQIGCENLCFTPCDEEGASEYCCIILRPIDNGHDFDGTITETIPCCAQTAEEVIILISANFSCIEPPNGAGILNGVFGVVNGSGNYGFQILEGENWVTVESPINSSFYTVIESPENETISTRVIDLETGVFSNVIDVETTICIGCENATVENSDATFTQVIPSGNTYILADTSINVYVNGVLNQVIVRPSMIDRTININAS